VSAASFACWAALGVSWWSATTVAPSASMSSCTLAAFTVIFAAGQIFGPYLAGALADRYGTGATLAWSAALCAAATLSAISRTKDH
jgi:MFS family permease